MLGETKMKKFLMAVFALAVAASVATAGVGISWSTLYGAYDHDSPDVTGGSNALLDSYSALWQLIYAGANNVADAIDDPMNPVDPIAWAANDYLAGDDVLWAQRTISMGGGAAPEDGTVWDNWMINQPGPSVVYEDLAWNTAGFVYMRVFEGSSPAGSSWFYQTGLLALDVGYVGGGAPTQDFFVDTFSAGFQPDSQVMAIPEPATMGLLGLGALVLAIRRRRA
jgi:hypothetical protein